MKHLKSEGIVDGQGFERLIVEKPFGTDLETASQLNKVEETFDEEQIFGSTITLERNDQNIFAIRLEILFFLTTFGTEILLTSLQITFSTDTWELKNAVATMIIQGPFEIWCKTIPFSFCLCLQPATFTKVWFELKKLKFFEQLYNPTDEN